jgi:hypothetical protein
MCSINGPSHYITILVRSFLDDCTLTVKCHERYYKAVRCMMRPVEGVRFYFRLKENFNVLPAITRSQKPIS